MFVFEQQVMWSLYSGVHSFLFVYNSLLILKTGLQLAIFMKWWIIIILFLINPLIIYFLKCQKIVPFSFSQSMIFINVLFCLANCPKSTQNFFWLEKLKNSWLLLFLSVNKLINCPVVSALLPSLFQIHVCMSVLTAVQSKSCFQAFKHNMNALFVH